jgi:hypothetical protein
LITIPGVQPGIADRVMVSMLFANSTFRQKQARRTSAFQARRKSGFLVYFFDISGERIIIF